MKRSRAIHCDAGDQIFAAGVEHPTIYIVVRGVIKTVAVGPDGQTRITGFSFPGYLLASATALPMPRYTAHLDGDDSLTHWVVGDDPGTTSFAGIAITNSLLVGLPFATVISLAEVDLGWSRALYTALAVYAATKEQRERDLLVLSAEDRYRKPIQDPARARDRGVAARPRPATWASPLRPCHGSARASP